MTQLSPETHSQAFIEQLLALTDLTAQKTFLQNQAVRLQDPACAEALATALKQQADHFLRTEIGRSQAYVQLLQTLADVTNNPLYRALSLRVEGNIHGIGQGNFQEAINCYDAAAAIYQAQGRFIEEAQTQVGKIGCLARLSRHEEAFRIGAWARGILRQHQQWELLIGLLTNLAVIHYRLGQGQTGLVLLDEARQICHETGLERDLPGIEVNRALVLRVLGRLEASVAASQQAWELFTARGQTVGAALAQQIQATTYLFFGRFNEALTLFDQVRAVYLADGRFYDAIVVQLFLSDCLLQLGRFQEALESCRQARALFSERGAQHEMAQSVLNEAIALAGLRRYESALAALDEAHARFTTAGNEVWAAMCHLEKAAVLYQQGNFQAAFTLAQACRAFFQTHQQPIPAVQATLLAARAALALGKEAEASHLVANLPGLEHTQKVPWLGAQYHHLLGLLAQRGGDSQIALTEYEQAIDQVEQLRGQLMIEFRADFLTNKQQVYEDVVLLCLALGQPDQALSYVERAKSRALVELLAFQLDLRVRPRATADQPLVDELQTLRDQRNQLMRRWAAAPTAEKAATTDIQQTVFSLEQQITQLWHTLLIRNADYAHDAALTQVRVEPVQPYLDAHTLLIEFFVAHDELLAFLVTQSAVSVHRLPGVLPQLIQPARRLELSLKAVPQSQPSQSAQLSANTQRQLQALYYLLLEPLASTLVNYPRLIFVPHGAVLHYLPFHALHNGRSYLIEQHEVSYLPSASLLHYTSARRVVGETAVSGAAFGYSCNGLIPYAGQEAAAVAHLLNGTAYLEEEATIGRLQEVGPTANVLHLATHGHFNPNNPLFSGLTLADGQLNTLDIFNLRLPASLVTLSACQTGHSILKGGDELLGLMRAFLYAGAASLVLTQWLLTDDTTLRFMEQFYRQLTAGQTKGAALQTAQQHFIQAAEEPYTHPYYWAPFFLIGNTQTL